VLLGLRYPQLALLGSAGWCFVALLDASGWAVRAAAGVASALCLAVAFTPLRGRTVDQYIPVAVNVLAQRLTGQHVFRGGPFRIAGRGTEPVLALPGDCSSTDILPLTVAAGAEAVAILHDRRRGTYTGVLAVEGHTFALLETREQARRVEAWGTMLAALCREGGSLSRIQILERTVVDNGAGLLRDWRRRGVDDSSWQAQAYLELVTAAGATGRRHETYVAVTVDPRRGGRRHRRGASPAAAASSLLLRELGTVSAGLADAGVTVLGWLPPRALAYVIRTAFDPAATASLDRRDSAGPDAGTGVGGGLPGVDPRMAGPMRAVNAWDHYRTDSGYHRTYWVMQWPRVHVPAGFLAPLLLATSARRTLSLTMEPVPARRAAMMIEVRQSHVQGEWAARDRVRRRTSRRQQVEAADLERREDELVAGHGYYRLVALVTVSADSHEELEFACSEVLAAAHQSRLELAPLYGEQDQAFACGALPLARGLR
jgi:hypothetical protein